MSDVEFSRAGRKGRVAFLHACGGAPRAVPPQRRRSAERSISAPFKLQHTLHLGSVFTSFEQQLSAFRKARGWLSPSSLGCRCLRSLIFAGRVVQVEFAHAGETALPASLLVLLPDLFLRPSKPTPSHAPDAAHPAAQRRSNAPGGGAGPSFHLHGGGAGCGGGAQAEGAAPAPRAAGQAQGVLRPCRSRF